jgi:hypothetical protein
LYLVPETRWQETSKRPVSGFILIGPALVGDAASPNGKPFKQET